ncbi:MAG: hypothetical protein IPN67_21830 [Bacteroidales bacterium]|nr:hypothetical protein [Bacteroidales bacterium]
MKKAYQILIIPLFIMPFFLCCKGEGTNDPVNNPDVDTICPSIPHIHSLETDPDQPHESDTNVIWYDDFSGVKSYLESTGGLDYSETFGKTGGSMKAGFKLGDIAGEGNRKVAFGDFPSESGVVKSNRHFDEIYWRFYVNHQYGWQGAPGKMTRATSIVSETWQQSMIMHVWSGNGNSITLDPASGVYGQTDSIRTTKYNDFENLSWLGNKPESVFQISSASESGYWVMVEAAVKLNTPGLSDGSCRLWIDGMPDGERTNLNFRGSYSKHGINAIFLESYWNSGAVKTEERWFDNFIISARPIGPVTCQPNPTLFKTIYHGPGTMEAWEIELASDREGNDVVYRSGKIKESASVKADTNNGSFAGSATGDTQLKSGSLFYCRVRQKSSNGRWSEWSKWHQPFTVS